MHQCRKPPLLPHNGNGKRMGRLKLACLRLGPCVLAVGRGPRLAWRVSEEEGVRGAVDDGDAQF